MTLVHVYLLWLTDEGKVSRIGRLFISRPGSGLLTHLSIFFFVFCEKAETEGCGKGSATDRKCHDFPKTRFDIRIPFFAASARRTEIHDICSRYRLGKLMQWLLRSGRDAPDIMDLLSLIPSAGTSPAAG